MWNRTSNQIEVILLRHGMTLGNENKAYIGATDEPLSVKGAEELQRKYKDILPFSIDEVYISPMLRCRQTAEILFPKENYIVVDDFREIDFGEFEGKNYIQLSGVKEYQDWIASNGTIPFPNGEGKEKFMERTMRGFCFLLRDTKKARKEVSRVVAVVHGGTIMTILSSLYGGDYYDYQVKNGLGYRCIVAEEDGHFQITEIGSIL